MNVFGYNLRWRKNRWEKFKHHNIGTYNSRTIPYFTRTARFIKLKYKTLTKYNYKTHTIYFLGETL